jgi:hypothetical protein
VPKVLNIDPQGALIVPSLGLHFDAGQVLEVTDEQAEKLLTQTASFAPADEEPTE